MHRKVLIFGFLILMFSALFITNCFAKIDTEIYVNGIKLSTDVPPEIINNYTYVPIRSIGEILGFDVSYDEAAEKITMDQKELCVNIVMTVNDTKAYVNNQEVTLPAPAVIVSGRTLVPVRFVSEALKSKVDWEQGYEDNDVMEANKVKIFTSAPIKLVSQNANISSDIYNQFQKLPLYDAENSEVEIGYNIVYPRFSGMRDASFQETLNNTFYALFLEIKQDTDQMYAEQKDPMGEGRYSYTYDVDYSITNEENGILAIMEDGYIDASGPHGTPIKTMYNIDFNKSKILKLNDIFIDGADYNSRLLQEMNNLLDADPDNYNIDDDKVTEIPFDDSFYFDNGNLIIYYPPYDLACYARGFVYFDIPLGNLLDILKDEYKNM